ncbi:RHS repeat-associated core domain-containing protein [Fulvivirgaceae bacterium LMO-SS25]
MEISRQAFTNPEELALDITASQGGFVEVYVYNASSLPVWYDQFSISSSQAVIIQENHYYPFGMQIAGLELDLGSKNRYLYNGKELQDDHDLDWHDYGARMYDAQIGRWHVVDPMADSYLSFSPYNYTLNNPLSNIDPNGMWVSTFQISQFLAQQTDPDRRSDEGSSFIQSVSRGFKKFVGKFLSGSESEGEVVEEEQGGESMGLDVLQGTGRPDEDGYISFWEARNWYRNGEGKSLYANLAGLDLGKISAKDFPNGVGSYRTFNLDQDYFENAQDATVFGSITLQLTDQNTVQAYRAYDIYDFDIKPLNGTASRFIRNVATMGALVIHGSGNGFIIYIYGQGKIGK